MVLVGGGDTLAEAVVPVVAGAGVSLRREETPPADGGRRAGRSVGGRGSAEAGWSVGSGGSAGSGRSAGAGSVVLWWAGLTQPPPAGAVLVDVEQERLWAAAARAPGHRAVQLPVGRAWLAEHLGGSVGLGSRGPGRVLLVGGLGEAHHSAKVARELALAAHRGGIETVLVDADPRGSLRFLAGGGTLGSGAMAVGGAGPGGAGSGGAGSDGAGSGGTGVGGRAGTEAWWPDALAWAKDGAAHALIGALPQWRGVPLLTWNALANGDSAERWGAEPAADLTASSWGSWPSAAQLEVVGALARGTELVVADAGPLGWPLTALPGGSAASSPISEVVMCAGDGAPWGENRWLDSAGTGLPPGVQGSLITVRHRLLPVDGPVAARALGVGWAGTLDVRSGRRGDGELRRAGRRMMQRQLLPRLHRGVALGAQA